MRDRGVVISVNPDAHTVSGLDCARTSLPVVRKGWIRPDSVLDTRDLAGVRAFLVRQRELKGAGAGPRRG